MATQKRKDVVEELRALRAGIAKNLSSYTFFLGGQTYPAADILSLVDQAIDSAWGIVDAHAKLSMAVRSDQQFQMVNGATLKLVRDQVRLMYKDNHTGLGDFGVKPYRARAPLTNDVLLVRAEKAKATRVVRRTMGKRQKAAIRGDVTGVVIEPIVAGASEAKIEGPEKVW